MEELLRTLYELNEQYHNTKERIVWLAGVIYFTFSIVVLTWISKLPKYEFIWINRECLIILTMVFLTSIFCITSIFIICQTWHKCRSAIQTNNFHALIKHLDDKRNRNYRALIEVTRYKGGANFFREGWSGVLILAAVLIFYFAQVALLYIGICNKISLLYIFLGVFSLFVISWFIWRRVFPAIHR